MGKGDFICTEHGVIEKPFISISTFRKYKCPECGILCKKCVKSSLWSQNANTVVQQIATWDEALLILCSIAAIPRFILGLVGWRHTVLFAGFWAKVVCHY